MYTPDGRYRIDGSEIGLLGSGAHGVVRIAQHVETLEYVAVKITPTSVVRSACKEVTALTRLNNAHIVQLLGVQVDMAKERVYMVMELCHGGELFDRIAECGGLVESEARRYFVQIVHALAHCHEKHVYHRDLKPENILLDAEDNAKVADFGLAAVYRHVSGGAGYLQHTKVGSIMYAAPEVLVSTASSGYDASCADAWSLGVILFSMLSGTLPFTCAAASKCKRYAAVMRHGINVMCPEHLSPQVTTLLAQLLHPDPSKRVTPREALQSDWVLGGGDVWPSHLLGLNRRADDSGARSWTITMAVPTHHLHALPSCTATERSPPAQQQPQPPQPQQPQPPPPPPQQQQQQQQGGMPSPGAAGAQMGADAAGPDASGTPAGTAVEAADPMITESTAATSGASSADAPQRASPCLGGEVAGSCGGSCAGSGCGAAAPGGASSAAANLLASPAKRKREADGAIAALAATDPAASAGGDGAGGSVAPSLSALPLRGCVSEYVERWGWGTLPQGTEQMLRDILQTLQSMGLQYRLEEYSSLSAPTPGLLPAETPDDGGSVLQGGTVGSSMQPPPPARTTHRLALNILF